MKIACDMSWARDRIEYDPMLPSGDSVNRRIVRACEKTRALIYEYDAGLAAIFPNNHATVERGAAGLWPAFNAKTKSWVGVHTMARWQRMALAEARRRLSSRRQRDEAAVKRLDIFQRTMKRNPALPYRDICDSIDNECNSKKLPIPLSRKCQLHGHKTLVESIDCATCRSSETVRFTNKRKPLGLSKASKSKFPSVRQRTN
jgi:hypothetical protein